MKKAQNPFRSLNRRDVFLWVFSLCAVAVSYLLSPDKEILTLIASLIGVTALIFLAKGDAFGHLLILFFALLYGYISVKMRLYGEMLTYVGMSAPMAVFSLISWMKNPFQEGKREVKITHVTKKQWAILIVLNLAVTFIFYFLLKALNTANLYVSTISVSTSFLAASLSFLRSPYYALGYSANDIVLIILWVVASIEAPENVPMILCFITFLINDLYGFYNWKKMRQRQDANAKQIL